MRYCRKNFVPMPKPDYASFWEVQHFLEMLADREKRKHMMEQHDFDEACEVMANTLKQLIDRLQYGDGQVDDE